MENKFNAGDIVMLKSGGPRMTAGHTEQGSVDCTWFDKEQNVQNRYFYEELLETTTKAEKISF